MRRILRFIRRHYIPFGIAGAVLLGLAIWAIFFPPFKFITYFTNETVRETEIIFQSGAVATLVPTTVASDGGSPTTGIAPDAPATTAPIPGIVKSAPAEWTGGDSAHGASGEAFLTSDGNQTFVAFMENFRARNGPDLRVYLVKTGERRGFGDEFKELGKLKGNRGSQSYEIPEGTDLSEYNTVLVWCRPFSVLFASVDLNPLP